MKRISAIMLAMILLTATACGKSGESVGDIAAENIAPDFADENALYTDPVETVRSYFVNRDNTDYEIAPTELIYAFINDKETEHFRDRYSGTDNAAGSAADESGAVSVTALYYCQYDHTKTFMDDGYCKAHYYLLQEENGYWEIFDSMTPSSYASLEELLNSVGLTETDISYHAEN